MLFQTQSFRSLWTFIFAINLLFSPNLFSQTFTKLFDFEQFQGSRSHSKLISDGNYFYGITLLGGEFDKGVIFKIKEDGSDFIKLHDFDGTDGYRPYNSLTLVGTELFGVTFQGGLNDQGVLFKINTDGSGYTKLVDFSVNNNGKLPQSSLLFDGVYLYGTTYSGGLDAGGGMIYKIRPDGTDYTLIHSFIGGGGTYSINGSSPQNDLLLDGTYLYGVTFAGGENEDGTIYRIKTDGSGFEKLHDFTDTFDHQNVSSSGLMLHEGFLYGNTFLGTEDENGFIYKIKTDGTEFEILHNFDINTGAKPAGELVFHNGFLYGTTAIGGIYSGGVIFKIKPDGTEFSKVLDFTTEQGYGSRAGLYKFGNSLYGITTSGGNYGHGTLFKYDDEILSIDSFPNHDQFKIYPNPVQTQLIIEPLFKNFPTEFVIYDQLGRKVMVGNIETIRQPVNLSNLKTGIYFIEIGKETYKIIKK